MEQPTTYVGIDVAKDGVDIAVRPTGDSWHTPYDEAEVALLVAKLQDLKPAGVVMEATGGLEVPLAAALAAASLPVAVVNPRQVRDFAKSTGRLAKTDALDAQVWAHFAEAVRPEVRPLPDHDTQELNALTVRRSQLMTMLIAEKNRLGRATGAVSPAYRSTSTGWKWRSTTWIMNCGRRSCGVRFGVSRTTCSGQFPAWESKSPACSLRISQNWARWTASRSPPWLEWRQ